MKKKKTNTYIFLSRRTLLDDVKLLTHRLITILLLYDAPTIVYTLNAQKFISRTVRKMVALKLKLYKQTSKGSDDEFTKL